MNNYFKPGCWNVICDVCGFKKKSDEVKKRWDGLIVCKEDWETDHPQKYIRVRESGLAVPYIRDEPADQYVSDYVCYFYASFAYADLGEADCMRADMSTLSYTDAAALKGS